MPTDPGRAAARDVVRRLREGYRPPRVSLLFVAESPPADDPAPDVLPRFFYNAEREGYDYLYRALMEVVFPDFDRRRERGQKAAWLARFRDRGCYLVDATDEPLNRLSNAERRRRLRAAAPGKVAEITALVAPTTPIVLIKRLVYEEFAKPLRRAGLRVVHDAPLPFPSHGHQRRFVEGCRATLRDRWS